MDCFQNFKRTEMLRAVSGAVIPIYYKKNVNFYYTRPNFIPTGEKNHLSRVYLDDFEQ